MNRALLGLIVGVLLTTGVRASGPEVTGAWKLNHDLTVVPDGQGQRPPQGRPGGGRGGFGGFGGFGGGSGGPGGGPSEKKMHQMEVVRRRLTEIPERLIITRDGGSVTITDGYGRSVTLKADGKKQDRLTGDGEFTSKTHFEGSRLIVQEDFDGPKVTTTFAPVLAGGEILRLEVTVKVEGMPRGPGGGRGGPGGSGDPDDGSGPGGRQGPPELKRVYDSEAR